MAKLDVYHRAFINYRGETKNNKACVTERRIIKKLNDEFDVFKVKKFLCSIDDEWIQKIEKGLEFVEKAVAEKKSFANVAREGGAKVESVKDFVLSDPKGEAVMRAYSAINSTLPTLKVGGVSKVQTFAGNAYIFELVKFTAPSEKADADKLKNISKRMIELYSMISSMSVVSEKVQAQEENLQDKQ